MTSRSYFGFNERRRDGVFSIICSLTLTLCTPTFATSVAAQEVSIDSARQIPCSKHVARARARNATASELRRVFYCQGDHDQLSETLWARNTTDIAVLNALHEFTPGSERVIKLMAETAIADGSIERRFTALGILARLVEPNIYVTASDATERSSRDRHGVLHYHFLYITEVGPSTPALMKLRPSALDAIRRVAAESNDERMKAASRDLLGQLTVRDLLRRPE